MPNVSYTAQLAQEAADPATSTTRLTELARDPQLAALVAANPSTPAALLDKLGQRNETGVQRAVAANPNTPLQRLLALAGHCVAEFFANPMLPLLFLEHPDLLQQLPRSSLLRLVLHPDAPAFFLKLLTTFTNEDIAEAARLHVNFAGEAGLEWRAEAERTIRGHELEYGDEFLLELIELGGTIPTWLVLPLIVYGNAELRRVLARSANVPASTRRALVLAGVQPNLRKYGPPDPAADPDFLAWSTLR